MCEFCGDGPVCVVCGRDDRFPVEPAFPGYRVPGRALEPDHTEPFPALELALAGPDEWSPGPARMIPSCSR
jgi:hypothetical protein